MMSDEAKDFVSQLLNTCPQKRLSAMQALQHPWLNFESISKSQGRTKGNWIWIHWLSEIRATPL